MWAAAAGEFESRVKSAETGFLDLLRRIFSTMSLSTMQTKITAVSILLLLREATLTDGLVSNVVGKTYFYCKIAGRMIMTRMQMAKIQDLKCVLIINSKKTRLKHD